METINYKDLNVINPKDNYTIIKYIETEIKVLTYLPMRDKYDLIMITLQKAEEDGFYNPIKTQLYMNLYIVYMYTNIVFNQEDKVDEFALYDELEKSGLLDEVIHAIPEDEYEMLKDLFYVALETKQKHNQSVTSLMQKVINDLPKNAETAANIVNNFNPENYKEVLELAKNSGMRSNK